MQNSVSAEWQTIENASERIWAIDLDGTGSMHPSYRDDVGAIEYVRKDLYTALQERVRELEAALAWQSTRREDALDRIALNAPEDPHVEALCSRYGYGAVIDAAARLWARKDKSGAFFVGGCLGDNSASAALAKLRKAMEAKDAN